MSAFTGLKCYIVFVILYPNEAIENVADVCAAPTLIEFCGSSYHVLYESSSLLRRSVESVPENDGELRCFILLLNSG